MLCQQPKAICFININLGLENKLFINFFFLVLSPRCTVTPRCQWPRRFLPTQTSPRNGKNRQKYRNFSIWIKGPDGLESLKTRVTNLVTLPLLMRLNAHRGRACSRYRVSGRRAASASGQRRAAASWRPPLSTGAVPRCPPSSSPSPQRGLWKVNSDCPPFVSNCQRWAVIAHSFYPIVKGEHWLPILFIRLLKVSSDSSPFLSNFQPWALIAHLFYPIVNVEHELPTIFIQ